MILFEFLGIYSLSSAAELIFCPSVSVALSICVALPPAWPLGEAEPGEFDCAYPMPPLEQALGCREARSYHSGGWETQSEMWESRKWDPPGPVKRPGRGGGVL